MVLEKVNTPQDLRKIPLKDFPILADEIRSFIINSVSKTGGHLAPSLGVVELTMALHYVYNTPEDKIVWDVGHQAYPHKILTGRKNKFYSIRKYGGISGFPKRDESPHDHFGVGHASTSISAALGMVCANDLSNGKNKTIVVIGDGALTGGTALEGLNNAGYLNKDILIILNDNRMSISTNVGALAENSKRIKNTDSYKKVRSAYNILEKKLSSKKELSVIKKELYTLLTPEVMFTKLGFDYTGPVDGHDSTLLISTLKKLKQKKGPKILHVLTKKGKGYSFAEENATAFHGIAPFDVKTGKKNGTCKLLSYSGSFSDIICDMARKNKKIVAITAAMTTGTGLVQFASEFPDRFFDVGIAEGHAVTFAGGLATQGYIPIVAIYSTFLQRAYDHIIHDIALQKLPVIFAIDRGGLVGDDGPTHHGAFDLSYLTTIPNMIIAAPKDEEELQDLFYSAVMYKKPIAIRYPRGSGMGICISEKRKFIPIGSSKMLKKGADIVIVGIGSTVEIAKKAHKRLKKMGINASVVNARFVKPIDPRLIRLIKSIGKVLVIEENTVVGGFGSYLRQEVNSSVKMAQIGLPDQFIEQGNHEQLKMKYGISEENIIDKVKKLLNISI